PFRLAGIEALQRAARHGAAQHVRELHPRHARVEAVLGAAADDGGIVDARRALADDAVVLRVLERNVLRYRQFRRRGGQLAIARAAAAGVVDHGRLLGAQRRRVDAPLRGGRADEHRPRGGRRRPETAPGAVDAAAAARAEAPVLRTRLRLLDPD